MKDKPTEEEKILTDISLRIDSLRSDKSRKVRDFSGVHGGMRGAGLGMRVMIELFAALVVGSFIGYSIDTWLGSLPFVMVIGFILGGAAGIMNVIRLSKMEDLRQQRQERESGENLDKNMSKSKEQYPEKHQEQK